MTAGPLHGKIVVVAGATRGAGRGIACAFGELGATVICTGRSSATKVLASDYVGRPETIEETAELVSSLGAKNGARGVAKVVDHLDVAQVRALASWLRAEYGHIDVLVNDIWGAEDLKGGPGEWDRPIDGVDLDKGLRILRLAIDTHLITAHALHPLLRVMPGGVHVEVTDGTNDYNATHYRISAFYDLAKVAANRLAFSFGHELAKHGDGSAMAVAVTPGWMRSEIMLEAFSTTEATWRDALGKTAPPGFEHSETPRFVGRAIAALVADEKRAARWNQRSVSAIELARAYGVVDIDGTQPDAWSVTP